MDFVLEFFLKELEKSYLLFHKHAHTHSHANKHLLQIYTFILGIRFAVVKSLIGFIMNH